jgi:two-component system NtrC family sensor kinase
MKRWAPIKLDRLTVRLAVGIALLVIVPVSVGLTILSRYHFEHTISTRREAAELENRMLEAALRHQMIQRDSRLMTDILLEVGRQPEVRSAMVLDHDGIIRLSSHEQQVGVRISRDSPTCLVCHSKTPDARERWVLIKENGEDVLRSVLPIRNRPECHRCHGTADKLNGVLILDISLAGVQKQLHADAAWMTGATALLTLVLLGGVGVLVRHLVLVRVARLSRTARAIAGGALSERATVEGGDVIASLATDFNSMAEAASSLIAAIKEREQQMAGVLNSLDDGLVVLDREFRVVAANHSISRRLCSYPEMLQGRKCCDVIGSSFPCRDDTDCPTARCLATGRLERAIYRFPNSGDESGRVHEVYASPVYSDKGEVAQVVEVWRDITERVREEEHLAEIERLSSLGVLASGLSHEVNTPLASTLTCADVILGRLQDQSGAVDAETLAAIRESAAIIRQQVLRCRKITDQFLRFARGIPPSVEPIDLLHVVKGILALAEPTARQAGIDVKLLGDGPAPLLTTNTEVVQHVVLNVLVNAIESFDGRGGTIIVRLIIDSKLRLQIRDDGCGIPPDVQQHLFEPFRTRKPRGTGLGLFLSRSFMRRFGGDVRLVESVVGKGSCIEILFPRSDQEAI